MKSFHTRYMSDEDFEREVEARKQKLAAADRQQ